MSFCFVTPFLCGALNCQQQQRSALWAGRTLFFFKKQLPVEEQGVQIILLAPLISTKGQSILLEVMGWV